MSEETDQREDREAEQRTDDSAEAETKAQANGKPPVYKRRRFWIIAILVVAAIVIGGTLYYLHARKYESTDDAFVDAHIVRIQPQIAGQITWVAPADNKHVKAGQLLARLDPDTPEAQLQQARAGVAEADAGIEQARGNLIAARAQVEQARANATVPEIQAANDARDLARYRHLVALDPNAVSDTRVDAAASQARQSAARAAAARRDIATARAQVEVATRGIAAAKAQRQAAEARVAQAKVTVGDLTVRAPIAGQVVNRNINVGSTVSPQSQMMALVPEKIWVTANFKETQLSGMRQGQPVDIAVDAFPGIHFHGHIDSVQRGAGQAFALLPPQNSTGNFVKVVQRVPVRIVFDRDDNGADPRRYPIGPGMSVVPTVKVR